MQGDIKVTAEFFDGRPKLERLMPVEYPDGKETVACAKLLAQINATGGIMDFLENGGVALIPIASIKLLTIEPPAICSASPSDLANLTMPTIRKQ